MHELLFLLMLRLNPDIYLKRSKTGIDEDSLQWRLDHVLLRKAVSSHMLHVSITIFSQCVSM